MRLSLIISTYNQPLALRKVLRGLEYQTQRPDEILIADDGSGEPTRRLVTDWKPTAGSLVKHVWHPDLGFRKTVILNEAIARAEGDYLVLLDGDCVPHHRFIEDHNSLAENGLWVQGRRCFVQERFVPVFEPGMTPIWRWMLLGHITGVAKGVRLPFPFFCRNREQRGILGCNMGFWREDLVAVNGFDEAYTGWGIGEDSDVGTRLYHLGRPRKFVYGHAIVYHLNHPIIPRDHFQASQARLAETIRTGRIRCEHGLDRHLAAANV
jgi:glycosyltransferase involved in cell wall biosynthesis